MNILVFNCGSSSLKYKLLQLPQALELAGGEAQRVGPPTAKPAAIFHRFRGQEQVHQLPMPDHAVAFAEVMKLLARDPQLAVHAVGHRLVHGGTTFAGHTILNQSLFDALDATRELAPLHNPPAITLAKACHQLYPDLPAVLVFDTAYHSTIPDHARTYALPEHLRTQLGLRKYGFHGTSHQYVVAEAAKFLNRPLETFNAVSCHLGSGGASLCAVVNGRSIDNTMGHSPLQGLIMSTRCGDLDPAVVMHLLARHVGDHAAVEKMLNTQSGVLGLSGSTADIRDVIAAAESRQNRPRPDCDQMAHALQTYIWRIKKYLGAYLTVVGNAHAVIFTDTIGETVPFIRQAVCAGLECFGLEIDPLRNDRADKTDKLPADFAADPSPIRALAVATNEELAIARFTFRLLTPDPQHSEKTATIAS